jgi:hypothetical protein
MPSIDASFPEMSTRVLANSSITPEIGGKILSGGARLCGFSDADVDKAADPARRRSVRAAYGRGATTYSAQFRYTVRQLRCLISIL